jgi:hypothetical protein
MTLGKKPSDEMASDEARAAGHEAPRHPRSLAMKRRPGHFGRASWICARSSSAALLRG